MTNIPQVAIGEVAIGEVAIGEVAIKVDEEVIKEPSTKSEKWKAIEPLLTDTFKIANVELCNLLNKFYRPNSGGGGHLKDMSRRVEDVLGKLLAKRCDVLGLWFLDEAFSKNKYMTKVAYSAVVRKKKDIDAQCRTLLMSGQGLDEVQRLIYDPASDKLEVDKAIIGLLGDETQTLVDNLHTSGLYCGSTKEEVTAHLVDIGKL